MSRLAPRSPAWLIHLWMNALLDTSSCSEAELLAAIMVPDPALSLSRLDEILLLAGGLRGLVTLDGESLLHLGLEPWDTCAILAAGEMARRLLGASVLLPLG